MKALVFAILGISFLGSLLAQNPSPPTNLVLTISPTDSLGLFIPGYPVNPTIQFQVSDTLSLSLISVVVGTYNGDSSILTKMIPFHLGASYYANGASVVRTGNTIWFHDSFWAYHPQYHVGVRIKDIHETWSTETKTSVLIGQ